MPLLGLLERVNGSMLIVFLEASRPLRSFRSKGMLPAGSTVMLVTSAFHMPRARRLFGRQGLTVLAFAVDFQASGAWAGHPLRDPLNYLPTADGLKSSSRALREAIGRTILRAW